MSFWNITLRLFEGFGTTCLMFILTLALSLPLGLVLSFGSMSKIKPLRFLTRGFVYVIRGTPLLLQLFIAVYIPGILGFPITRWAVFGGDPNLARFCGALIAFVINYSAYFSEIYRGGIESISRGQYEAGQVLGMTSRQIFFKIVLLQVVKRIIPPICNETITLVKDTALVRVVAVYELLFFAEEIVRNEFVIWPIFYTGAFYLAFNALLTWLFNKMEARLSYFRS